MLLSERLSRIDQGGQLRGTDPDLAEAKRALPQPRPLATDRRGVQELSKKKGDGDDKP